MLLRRLMPMLADTFPAVARPSRSRLVWLAIAIYAGGLVALALAGVYVYIVKALVWPLVVALGVQTAGHRAFVRDWAVPFAFVALFDAGRGLIYAAVMTLQLPIYLHYAIDWERAWFGTVLPVAFQATLRAPVLDRIAIVFHGSHFAYFLLFALAVWAVDRHAFARWARGFYVVTLGGLAVYLLVPTIPPWMAAGPEFGAIPPIEHIVRQTYTHAAPVLLAGFDTNTIAAMPSLHVAMPAYCALVGWRLGGRVLGSLLLLYALCAGLAVIYLGEHYGVDVIGGAALALAGYLWGFHRPLTRDRKDARPYLTAGVILVAAVLCSVGTGVLLPNGVSVWP